MGECLMPVPPIQTKMVLENRKYCTLYPRETKKLVKKTLKPTLKHCKEPYTTNDFKLETCVQEQLLKLEEQFRVHHDMVSKEKKLQYELSKKLWATSTRYSILTRGGVCYKPYPPIVSQHMEYRTLCKFYSSRNDLDKSNCRLSVSLQKIKQSLKDLSHRAKLLDHNVKSPFLTGCWRQPSFYYLQDLMKMMYFCYYEQMGKLKSWAKLIDPGAPSSIEDYKILVGSPTIGDEQYAFASNAHCACMRPKNPECPYHYHACRRHGESKKLKRESTK